MAAVAGPGSAGRKRVIGTTGGTTVVFSSRMKLTLVRLVAIVVLSLHVMPLGLPFFCDTDRRCDGQMPMSMPSVPTIDQTSNAPDCATSVFCAVMGTAALVQIGRAHV